MNGLIPEAWAQGAPVGPGPGGSPYSFIFMMVAFVIIFYFMLIRPQQKKQKEHQSLLTKLAAGDEVVTTGGILGRIVEVGDAFVTVEVADGVRLKVQKVQVASLMPKGTLKSA
jgi:preprotein translocase subunit YajC